MCIRIGIEDLVANALIELAEKKQKKEVYFKDLDKYGAVVVKLLNKEDEKAVLILSTERTNNFLTDYSEYYELFSDGKEEGIRLKENVEVDELWSKFRSYLSVKVMKAFMNKESVQALGV